MTGKQRKYLRASFITKKPVVQLGKDGITDAVINAIDIALRDHEVIKVALGHPESGKRELAAEVAKRAEAHECGLVGHNVILYKAHPEKPKIILPSASALDD